jgi:hypothetical protein
MFVCETTSEKVDFVFVTVQFLLFVRLTPENVTNSIGLHAIRIDKNEIDSNEINLTAIHCFQIQTFCLFYDVLGHTL